MSSDDGYIVKLRGLPWTATETEIRKFLEGINVLAIHLTFSTEGRPSGEAFVELDTEEDQIEAEARHRENMGSRYIEVFKVKRAEMEWVIKRFGSSGTSDENGCVRLRGLPFGCSKEEIAQFFTGMELVPNGITLLTDYSGRSSGEAYVQFASGEIAERALQKHGEKIGHRYIEVFRSSLSAAQMAARRSAHRGGGGGGFNSRPGPYDRVPDRFNGGRNSRGNRNFKGNYHHINPWLSQDNGIRGNLNLNSYNDTFKPFNTYRIHMRGLPFKATQQDVVEFFKPITPMTIHFFTEPSGRASGEAEVTFACHEDAIRAMSKDKGHMQHRYIELFLNSSNSSGGGGDSDRYYR